MATLGNRITTTTQDFFLNRAVDTTLNYSPLVSRVLSSAKKWRGNQMKFPMIVSGNTTGTSFSGYDTLGTGASDTRVNMTFDPKFYQISVSLPLDEISANKTPEGFIGVVDQSMEEASIKMADNLATLFYSDGTGNGAKDFLGLEAYIDDGGTVATYGGQSRSTYASLAATETASSGTLTLAKMATMSSAVTSGTEKPTVILTTEAIFNFFEALLQPQERIMKDVSGVKGMKGGTGFVALAHRGIPVLADEKCTAQTMYFVNENYLDFYALPVAETTPLKYKKQTEGSDYTSDVPGLGFSWSGWIKPSNQAAVIGHVYLGGELIGRNPRRNGKLTGITGI